MLGRFPESLGLWLLLVELDAWKVVLTLLVSLEDCISNLCNVFLRILTRQLVVVIWMRSRIIQMGSHGRIGTPPPCSNKLIPCCPGSCAVVLMIFGVIFLTPNRQEFLSFAGSLTLHKFSLQAQ